MRAWHGAGWLALLGLLGCTGREPETGSQDAGMLASVEALQDPETCRACHAEHYREWASSMHAYAARDPVFVAMNERGQRETDGALGDFCVRCHAPMALELGLTRDGLNLPELDDPNARGVTCFFCHDVSAVEGDHNRALVLAGDAVMRGGLAEPTVPNPTHESAYSPLHDGARLESARSCGACHDVVNAQGVALERTFGEWRGSRFAVAGEQQETCPSCHMPRYRGVAAPGAPERDLHRHLWPGVDVALEPSFPDLEAQARAIRCAFEGALELTLAAVTPLGTDTGEPALDAVEVTLTNLRVGHAWPSGAAQDRRAWVELVAYGKDDEVIEQRGVVAAGGIVGAEEPELEVFRDRLYDADGAPVHMFWQAAPSAAHPTGHASNLLPAPSTDRTPASRTLRFPLRAPARRVTARLLVQSIGLDVLDDFQGLTLPITERVLKSGGYRQAPTLRSLVPTLSVPGSERELIAGEEETAAPHAGEPAQTCEAPPFAP